MIIKLGHKVRDRISQFEGVVTGLVDYISGCNQALVSPTVDKDGKIREGNWFDVQRLEVLDQARLVLDNATTPGCDIAPPRR